MARIVSSLERRGPRNIGVDELQRSSRHIISIEFVLLTEKYQAWAISLQFLYPVDIKNVPLDVNGMPYGMPLHLY